MRITLRQMLVILAVVLSLTAVNAVLARDCSETVIGTISAFDDVGNTITVDGIIIYGIPMEYLVIWEGIILEMDDYVVVTAHRCPRTGNLSACTLQVGEDGDVIVLPGRRAL